MYPQQIGEVATVDQQQPIADEDDQASSNQHRMSEEVRNQVASTMVTVGDTVVDVNCPNNGDNNVVMQDGVDAVG